MLDLSPGELAIVQNIVRKHVPGLAVRAFGLARQGHRAAILRPGSCDHCRCAVAIRPDRKTAGGFFRIRPAVSGGRPRLVDNKRTIPPHRRTGQRRHPAGPERDRGCLNEPYRRNALRLAPLRHRDAAIGPRLQGGLSSGCRATSCCSGSSPRCRCIPRKTRRTGTRPAMSIGRSTACSATWNCWPRARPWRWTCCSRRTPR